MKFSFEQNLVNLIFPNSQNVSLTNVNVQILQQQNAKGIDIQAFRV
jgi:hypothetical protein